MSIIFDLLNLWWEFYKTSFVFLFFLGLFCILLKHDLIVDNSIWVKSQIGGKESNIIVKNLVKAFRSEDEKFHVINFILAIFVYFIFSLIPFYRFTNIFGLVLSSFIDVESCIGEEYVQEYKEKKTRKIAQAIKEQTKKNLENGEDYIPQDKEEQRKITLSKAFTNLSEEEIYEFLCYIEKEHNKLDDDIDESEYKDL